MKYISLLLLCMLGITASAQHRIKFAYDANGNQISRLICINCSTYKNSAEPYKDTDSIKPEDMIQDPDSEHLSYYPNPVLEELYVKWKNTNSSVSTIALYNLNGQLIKSIPNLENIDATSISFISLPEGYYNLLLYYTNGEIKSLKIVKNQK